MASIVLTLRLPDPAPAILAAAGDVRILGRIPAREELTSALADADVLCAQLRDRVDAVVLDAAGP